MMLSKKRRRRRRGGGGGGGRKRRGREVNNWGNPRSELGWALARRDDTRTQQGRNPLCNVCFYKKRPSKNSFLPQVKAFLKALAANQLVFANAFSRMVLWGFGLVFTQRRITSQAITDQSISSSRCPTKVSTTQLSRLWPWSNTPAKCLVWPSEQ